MADQTIHSATALNGATAPGALVRKASDSFAPIEVQVFGRDDLTTPKAILVDSWDRSWQDIRDEAGSGSFTIDNEDPLYDLVALDDVVRFVLHGRAVFGILVDEIVSKTIDENEEIAQTTTFSGPGVLSMLEEALVYPSRGVGVLPFQEDRAFNWTTPDYQDEFYWPSAVEVCSITTAMSSWPQLPFGDGFPTDFTDMPKVLWNSTDAFTAVDIGETRARVGYIATGGALIYFVADDLGQLYFDGQLIIDCEPGFSSVYTAKIPDVTPGFHTVAVYCGNGPGRVESPGPNPAGFAVAIFPCDSNGEATSGTPDLISDSSWKLLSYVPPPGVSPGEVMLTCIDEAQARGCYLEITCAFDRDYDSAGNPWPRYADIATKVGTDTMQFFRQMSETYCELWMSPATLTLYAWVKGGRGVTRTTTLDPSTDSVEGDLVNLTHSKKR